MKTNTNPSAAITSTTRSTAPAATETTSAAPVTTPETNAVTSVPSDSAQVSQEASAGEEPKNPYEGISENFSSVTVDPWGKGKNDSVESMLRNQGYSTKEIYKKDEGGKTLIDHVASANKLKNPNVVSDGAKLNVPSPTKPEAASQEAPQASTEGSSEAAGTAAADGAPGTSEAAATEAANPLAQMSNEQLEDQAFSAKAGANQNLEGLLGQLPGLQPEQRDALGKSMFYEMASQKEFGERSPQELREMAAQLDPESKALFESQVKEWAGENEIGSQMGMAKGAVDWAAGSFDASASPEEQKKLLDVAQSGQGLWDNNNQILNVSSELNSREPGKGSGLYNALNSGQQ